MAALLLVPLHGPAGPAVARGVLRGRGGGGVDLRAGGLLVANAASPAMRRAQYPMLAAMVAFTAGGIALVAGS